MNPDVIEFAEQGIGCCPDPAALMDRMAKVRPKAMLVRVGSTTYQPLDGQPRTIASETAERWLSSDEQPYERKCKIGEGTRPFDAGWVERPGLLIVVNEGPRWQVVPTDAEAREAADRIIEVGVLEQVSLGTNSFKPLFLVRPGRQQEFEPALPPDQYHLRCRRGEARCVLWAIPS